MATHLFTRFDNDPKLCHEFAVECICKYLLGTMDKGLKFKPDMLWGLEFFIDADFAEGWATDDQMSPESVLSRTGFIIMYTGCPIDWKSKLQTEIALSTTEAEYIALSHSMHKVLLFIMLPKAIHHIFPCQESPPEFYCRVWELSFTCC